MGFPRKHLLPLFLLTLGVILIYSNSFNGDFLFDDQQILDRPNLHITDLSAKSIKGTFYFAPKAKKYIDHSQIYLLDSIIISEKITHSDTML